MTSPRCLPDPQTPRPATLAAIYLIAAAVGAAVTRTLIAVWRRMRGRK